MAIGVVLAAGSGMRMGGPKAELVVGGERLVDRAVRALRDGGCARVVAVVPPGVEVPGAIVAVNGDPERGMRSSLELALAAGDNADEVVVVLLADMPGVGAEAVRAVLAAWRPDRIAAACVGDRLGHPVAMQPALWHEALRLAGPDEGARRMLAARPDLVDAVPFAGDPRDLDTPDDLSSA